MSARHLALFGNRLPQPTLDLNFLAGVLDSRITYTGQNGTYFNSAGVLTVASANVARFDTDPATLAPRGLLVEESRQNIITNSQAINSWPTKTDTTVTDNSTASPDGTTDASLCTEGTASNAIITSNVPAVSAGATVTGSAFFKRGNTTWVRLIVGDVAALTNGAQVWLNVSTGALGTVGLRGTGTSASGTVQTIGNGWYRLTCTVTLPGGATTCAIGASTASADNNISRVNNGTYYFWGGQCEVGAFPTSYIPTTAAAVTRAADVATMPTGGWFNATQGMLAAEFMPTGQTASTFSHVVDLAVTATPNADGVLIYRNAATSAITGKIAMTAGGTRFEVTTTATAALNAISKGAIAWNANTVQAAGNGLLSTVGGAGAVPASDQLRLMGQSFFQPTLDGYLRRVRYWPSALRSDQLQQVTV